MSHILLIYKYSFKTVRLYLGNEKKERKIPASFLEWNILHHFRRNTVLSTLHRLLLAFSLITVCQKDTPFYEE